MQLSKVEQSSVESLLQNPEIECIGVVDPQILSKNIEEFRGVLGKYRFSSSIHYVMKVNQSKALLREALKQGCRVDVSSYGELMKSLEVGYLSDMITANGPKNPRFLEKCIEIGCTIAVDNLDELVSIIEIAKQNNKRQRILVRLGGFDAKKNTRFGILKEFWGILPEIIQKNNVHLEYIGYSFHLDMIDWSWRVKIFWESIEFLKKMQEKGNIKRVIDIGGSFGAIYTDDRINSDLLCSHGGMNRSYPDIGNIAGADLLTKIIEKEDSGLSIKIFLEENNIALWIEPGRALLYNTGYIATTIIGLREQDDEKSIIINTNTFGLGMGEEELPVNPYILSDDVNRGNIEDLKKYWILGNLCREKDMIYSRSVRFGRNIRKSDILIFPEMGAYHMDFFETTAIGHPLKSRYFIKNSTLYPDL